ncbi:MAG: PaaI family thioesterase [Acidimicrobiales bacterium]
MAGTLPDDARGLWISGAPAPVGSRGAKHRLAQSVRQLTEAVALLDPETLDPARLDRLARAAGDLADSIAELPSLAARGGAALAGGPDAVLAERSGISGRSNPLAPPMQAWVDGDLTCGRATYGPAYEGPPGCVHGGFVAAAFDDLLGCAQMASGLAGFTGTLTVRMVRPTPLGVAIDYQAGYDRIEGRKIYCWGTARAGATVVAEAQGIFIIPRQGSQVGANPQSGPAWLGA